jgi:hypothetical protein
VLNRLDAALAKITDWVDCCDPKTESMINGCEIWKNEFCNWIILYVPVGGGKATFERFSWDWWCLLQWRLPDFWPSRSIGRYIVYGSHPFIWYSCFRIAFW